jgi:hypothetical protein
MQRVQLQHGQRAGKLVLNPDVQFVQGVVESAQCVSSGSEQKLIKRKPEVLEGDIMTACQQSCR